MELLENFKAIELETPVDKIIAQIRGLIVSGFLKPGDKLPSERKLSDKLGVSRSYIRDAIKKLEFVGILNSLPQSGVVVNGMDIAVMEGLLSNIMKIEKPDFYALVETKGMMEKFSVQQAALRRTDSDIKAIRGALDKYQECVGKNLPAENEDFIFHLRIAEAGHNAVIKTMLLIILPEIMKIYIHENVCGTEVQSKRINEHHAILQAIIDKDGDQARKYMSQHLQEVLEFSKTTYK